MELINEMGRNYLIVDDMTDIVIRRDLFGTIIRETDEPYLIDKDEPKNEEPDRGMPKYEPILPKDVNGLYEPISTVADVQYTLKYE